MATYKETGILTHVDETGNEYELYPKASGLTNALKISLGDTTHVFDGSEEVNINIENNANGDWNQNDENAIDFIKNRPFGEFEESFNIFSEEISKEAEPNGLFASKANLPNEPDITYKVIINNVIYNVTSKYNDYIYSSYYGNLGLLGDTFDDTGEPFVVVGSDIMWKAELGETIVVTINVVNRYVKKIDEEYLPELPQATVDNLGVIRITDVTTASLDIEIGVTTLSEVEEFGDLITDSKREFIINVRETTGSTEIISSYKGIYDIGSVAHIPTKNIKFIDPYVIDLVKRQFVRMCMIFNDATEILSEVTFTPANQLEIASSTADSDKTFAISVDDNKRISIVNTNDEEDIAEVALKSDLESPDWNQNDENAADYVKNRTHWKEQGLEVIVDETSETSTTLGGSSIAYSLNEGQLYVVTVDNIKYRCICYLSSNSTTCLGDSRLMITWTDNGEAPDTSNPEDVPFLVEYEMSDDGSGTNWVFYHNFYFYYPDSNTHTIKIEKETDEVVYHQLDERFIPDTIARKSDLENIDLSSYETTEDAKTKYDNAVAHSNANLETAKKYADTAVASKVDASHTHDDRYYTETEMDSKLSGKSDTTHNHDSAYDAKGSADDALVSAKSYTDTKTSGLASTSSVNTSISTHNTSTSAHSDIRDLVTGLTNRLNALADSDDTTLDQMSEIVEYIKANKSLIDSITTSKVNVSDIVNNLTTNVSNKPLSAAQGVAIKALIDALQTAVDGKASSSDLTSHTGNSTVHITSAERTNWNAAYTHSQAAHAPSNAEANQNAFSNIIVGNSTIAADSTTDSLTFAQGGGITVSADTTNDKVTITNSGVRSVATGSTNGTISVNTGGTSAEVAVKGLGSAAYTASTAYATSGHTHNNYASTVTTTGSGNAITDITQSGNTITAVKNSTFLTAHPTITKSSDTTSSGNVTSISDFTVIDSVTRDSNGHVTKVNTKTLTMKPYIHSANAVGESAGYVKVATFTTTGTYINQPFTLELTRRGRGTTCNLYIFFSNEGDTDPTTVDNFLYTGTDYGCFIYKSATSTFDLYVEKTMYDHIEVLNYYKGGYMGVDVTWQNVYSESVPDGAIAAILGGSVANATKATQDASGNVIASTYATKSELNSAKSSLQTSIDGKSDSSHTHDDRYYTESEVDTKLSTKADSSHTHTKADVGLGNVDNTADANKSVKYATSAGSATTAKSIETIILTGGDENNTSGYRLIGSASIAAWGNYRVVFAVSSRHTGNGIVNITYGCNDGTLPNNCYCQINYFGNTSTADSLISSEAFQCYLSSDSTTMYFFWNYYDYNSCRITPLCRDGGFTISNGTWMTSISSDTYGTLIASTTINPSSSCSGNALTATSATKATQDASGNVITSTYATKSELNTAKTTLQASIDGKAASGHTHNYAGSSSAGGAATKVTSTLTNPSSATLYPIAFHSGVSTGDKSVLNNDGLRYQTREGTTSQNGFSVLTLGNSTASGTAGNKYGEIHIYSTSAYRGKIQQPSVSSDVTHKLPTTSGTLLNEDSFTVSDGVLTLNFL